MAYESSSSSDSEEFSFDQTEIVKPYAFEPTPEHFPNFKIKSRYGDEEETSEDLLFVSSASDPSTEQPTRPLWCTCGCCVGMQSEVEELCCVVVAPVKNKLDDTSTCNFSCITYHPGLYEVSLSKYGMEAYYNEFIDTSGRIGDDEPVHK
ncbi:uncharacterized protein LOC124122352 [Haliotis rufescens]|uniref:uncharacterized protein LOC124122352 n=1 Tax=Haliotis rufescens TaxID=6454 RepID=UPI00201E9822|nr:uncharacterized protein LOC124122352 [Haliotis rufescens]